MDEETLGTGLERRECVEEKRSGCEGSEHLRQLGGKKNCWRLKVLDGRVIYTLHQYGLSAIEKAIPNHTVYQRWARLIPQQKGCFNMPFIVLGCHLRAEITDETLQLIQYNWAIINHVSIQMEIWKQIRPRPRYLFRYLLLPSRQHVSWEIIIVSFVRCSPFYMPLRVSDLCSIMVSFSKNLIVCGYSVISIQGSIQKPRCAYGARHSHVIYV